MRDFKKLGVWQKAHALRLEVYRLTRRFPSDKRFGLTAQVRRAAGSVATNIAEGWGRRSDKEKARFVDIASSSVNETEDLLLLARDLKYLLPESFAALERQLVEVRKMLSGLMASLVAGGWKLEADSISRRK